MPRKYNRRAPRAPIDPVARFFSYVHPEPNTGCWLWGAALNHKGYGKFWTGSVHAAAHRFSYELHKGPIPAGLETDHLCRVKSCVNPDHLEAVTGAVNFARYKAAMGSPFPSITCLRGHPYAADMVDRPDRYCRACKALAKRERRMRKAA